MVARTVEQVQAEVAERKAALRANPFKVAKAERNKHIAEIKRSITRSKTRAAKSKGTAFEDLDALAVKTAEEVLAEYLSITTEA